MSMIVREMEADDLGQVAEIEKALFSVPWTKEGFMTYLLKPNAVFLVVEEKGNILGYCGAIIVLDEADITNVAVREERQREGIGNFLVTSLLRLAVDIGVTTLHLEVRKSNGSARRLYGRLGFEEAGIRKNYYTEPQEDAVLMTYISGKC